MGVSVHVNASVSLLQTFFQVYDQQTSASPPPLVIVSLHKEAVGVLRLVCLLAGSAELPGRRLTESWTKDSLNFERILNHWADPGFYFSYWCKKTDIFQRRRRVGSRPWWRFVLSKCTSSLSGQTTMNICRRESLEFLFIEMSGIITTMRLTHRLYNRTGHNLCPKFAANLSNVSRRRRHRL